MAEYKWKPNWGATRLHAVKEGTRESVCGVWTENELHHEFQRRRMESGLQRCRNCERITEGAAPSVHYAGREWRREQMADLLDRLAEDGRWPGIWYSRTDAATTAIARVANADDHEGRAHDSWSAVCAAVEAMNREDRDNG